MTTSGSIAGHQMPCSRHLSWQRRASSHLSRATCAQVTLTLTS